MSHRDAFEDEMGFLRRPERDPELAEFAGAIRAALIPPQAPGSALLVPRLAESARASAPTITAPVVSRAPAPRRRLGLAARIAVAVALLPLLSAGLAVAGVKLPGPAQSAFESVGIDLPNQGDDAAETPNRGGAGGGGESEQAEDASGTPAEPGAAGRENAADKRGHGHEKGKPARNKQRGNGAHGQPQSPGKSDQAPGHTKPLPPQSQGEAIGKTDGIPPGQANKPLKPVKPVTGSGGSRSGTAQGDAKVKDK